ncbi:hypothetical protein LLG95_15675 [bacterium]|nr:hypothetical protein [bacterium]
MPSPDEFDLTEPVRPRTFRLRDMLLPEALLDSTNWRDNPLVDYTDRRALLPGRRFFIRILEVILVLGWFAIVWDPFEHHYDGWFVFMPPDHYWDGGSGYFYWRGNMLVPLALVFLLLRYHLTINDQSNHLKTLSRGKLGELLLTTLGSEDYFLHHFLLFCRRYRVLVAWAAIWGLTIVVDILDNGVTWVQLTTLVRILVTLNVILLTWIMGVYQYVTEWRWFAGGRALRFRPFLSMIHSAALSLIVLFASAPWYLIGFVFSRSSPPSLYVLTSIALACSVPLALAVTYLKGRAVNAVALEWLYARYYGEDPAQAQKWMRPLDPLLPWRWKSPLRPACPTGTKTEWKSFFRAVPFIVLFVGAVNATNSFSAYYGFRASALAEMLLLAAFGICLGIWLVARMDAADHRALYLRAMWWMGLLCLALVSRTVLTIRTMINWPDPDVVMFHCYMPYLAFLAIAFNAFAAGALLKRSMMKSCEPFVHILCVVGPAALASVAQMGTIALMYRANQTGSVLVAFYPVAVYLLNFMLVRYVLNLVLLRRG